MAGPKATEQYEQVKAKIGEGLSVKDAVAAVAEERGMTFASVHTTYYRTAKEITDGPRPSFQAVTSRSGEVTESSEDILRQALQQAMNALDQLARRAEAQEKDLERLRRIERALTDT